MTKNPPRDGVAEVRGQIDRLETSLFDGAWDETQAAPPAETARQLTAMFVILESVDNANEMAWTEDRPRCKEISDALNSLGKRWLALAQHADLLASEAPEPGDGTGDLVALRKLIVEVKAFLNPSYVLAGGMLAIHDAAVAEYARGEFLEGLVD